MDFGFGFKFGIGRQVAVTSDITDFFNGFTLPGSTVSSGSVVVSDYTGALVTSPADTVAVEGMRLVTTLDEGANLGLELITNSADREFSSTTGFWSVAGVTIAGGTANAVTLGNGNGLYRLGFLTTGKRYLISYEITSISEGGWRVSAGNMGAGTTRTTVGSFSEEITCAGSYTLQIYTQGVSTTSSIDNISVREVVPAWVATDAEGTQIYDSTTLRTSSGAVKVYEDAFKGMRVAPARENVLTYSEQFNLGAWGNYINSVVLDNTVTFPLDGTSGSTLKDTAIGGTGYVVRDVQAVLTPNVVNTFSIYLKKGTLSWAALYGGNFTTNAGISYFDLTNGVIGATGANVILHTITPVIDGWYRCEISFNPGADAAGALRVALAVANNGAASVPLDGTSNIYICAAQAEAGYNASTYKKTVATSVANPAINITRPTAGTSFADLNNFAIYGRAYMGALNQGAYLLNIEPNTATGVYIQTSTVRLYINGVYITQNHAHLRGDLIDYLAYQHSVYGMGLSIRYKRAGVWSDWSAWVSNAVVANSPVGTYYQLGARANANHMSGNLPFTKVIRLPIGDEPQALLMSKVAEGVI